MAMVHCAIDIVRLYECGTNQMGGYVKRIVLKMNIC